MQSVCFLSQNLFCRTGVSHAPLGGRPGLSTEVRRVQAGGMGWAEGRRPRTSRHEHLARGIPRLELSSPRGDPSARWSRARSRGPRAPFSTRSLWHYRLPAASACRVSGVGLRGELKSCGEAIHRKHRLRRFLEGSFAPGLITSWLRLTL